MAGRPLAGRLVAVTRPAARAGELVDRLETLGAEVRLAPAIEVAPPADPGALAATLAEGWDWVVFTSANAVAAVVGAGATAAGLGGARVAAVGRATARALGDAGIPVALQPDRGGAEALLDVFPEGALAGARVLLPRAEGGLDLFPDGARARGAAVTVVTAYRTVGRPAAAEVLRADLRQGRLDAVVFTSPSGVEALVEGLGDDAARLRDVALVAIGGTTLAALEAAGLPGTAAATPRAEDLARAVIDALDGARP